MNKKNKLSKKELKLLAKEDGIPHEGKKMYLSILLILLLLIVLSMVQINYTLSSGYKPEFIPLDFIVLILLVCFLTFHIIACKLKIPFI